jgi:hypothetical protein
MKGGIATLKYFRIFNRWGTKVFEPNNIDGGLERGAVKALPTDWR